MKITLYKYIIFSYKNILTSKHGNTLCKRKEREGVEEKKERRKRKDERGKEKEGEREQEIGKREIM